MKVHIVYGLAEGGLLGWRLRGSLRKSGYSMADTAKEADIIITHSGGCYMLAESTTAQLIMLVGIPHKPGRPILVSTLSKIRREPKNLNWIIKSFFNMIYIFTKPHVWARMWFGKINNTLPTYKKARVIVLRNTDDAFSHREDIQSLAKNKKWIFKELPGQHDDIWLKPEPYVRLLNSLVKGNNYSEVH